MDNSIEEKINFISTPTDIPLLIKGLEGDKTSNVCKNRLLKLSLWFLFGMLLLSIVGFGVTYYSKRKCLVADKKKNSQQQPPAS